MKNLNKKTIYLIGTGAKKIAHLPQIIREFTQDGASVYTMMSEMGKTICDSNISDFKLAGNTMVHSYSRSGEALPLEDLVIVAPCTFNTMNKIANGIADTYPLTIAATTIGSGRDIIIAPAMNKNLWDHPMTDKSRNRLEKWGCKVIWPEISNDKVTMAPIEKVADTAYHLLCEGRYESCQQKRQNILKKCWKK
ncbi:MAG: flavoprotein, partial [Myxococcota bacterium]